MKAHCFFEQSGTFKNEFRKLGIAAEDYDIRNDFGETDHQDDLFKEIEAAYDGKSSLFDKIQKDDLIFAFFPCIRFEDQAALSFRGQKHGLENWKQEDKLEYAMKFHRTLADLYEMVTKLVLVCIRGGHMLIIENPYSEQHYLRRYWPIQPKIIDRNRHERGDYYTKPTQYYFINREPYNNVYMFPENYGEKWRVSYNKNQVQRSMISPDYARRFILEHVLPKKEGLMVI